MDKISTAVSIFKNYKTSENSETLIDNLQDGRLFHGLDLQYHNSVSKIGFCIRICSSLGSLMVSLH